MSRIYQYLQRVTNVVLFALPWNYQKRKLQLLEEMYHLSIDLLNGLDQSFWLDAGTLLGYYREGDFIPHDIDVDLAMMESAYDQVSQLKNAMPKGLKYYDTSAKHNGPKVYFSYKGYDLDIFFYKKYDDQIKCYLEGAAFNETQLINNELVFPLKKGTFKGKDVLVPNDTEGYLSQMYGYLGRNGTRNSQTGLWDSPF